MPEQPRSPSPAAARPLQRRLVGLAVLAAWSIVPPYLGPLVGLDLQVASSVEVVDHVLPGVAAIAGALIALSEARRGETDSFRSLAALGVCALAGLFQTASHFTLVLDAGQPLRPIGSVVLHATPGPALLMLSLWLLLRPAATDGSRAR